MYLLEGTWSFLIKNGEATEGRGPIVKYGEILVEGEECGKGRSAGRGGVREGEEWGRGEACENSMELPTCDSPIETFKYIW